MNKANTTMHKNKYYNKYPTEETTMVKLELGDWLKAEDLNEQGDTQVQILNEGEYRDGEINGKPLTQFVIKVTDGQTEKQWSMNRTSQRAVASHYGADTAAWVGKMVSLYVNTENVQGKMRKVIYAREKQTQ